MLAIPLVTSDVRLLFWLCAVPYRAEPCRARCWVAARDNGSGHYCQWQCSAVLRAASRHDHGHGHGATLNLALTPSVDFAAVQGAMQCNARQCCRSPSDRGSGAVLCICHSGESHWQGKGVKRHGVEWMDASMMTIVRMMIVVCECACCAVRE